MVKEALKKMDNGKKVGPDHTFILEYGEGFKRGRYKL